MKKNINIDIIRQIRSLTNGDADIYFAVQDASLCIKLAHNIDMEEMYNIGASDALVHLRHNTLALKSLLSQAQDAYECINSNLCAIKTAYEQAEENERKRKEEAIKRAKNAEREHEKYLKKKDKKNK